MKLRLGDIVRMVWKDSGVDLEIVRRVMRSAVDVITREVLAGKTISIRGFGAFDSFVRKARKFYNPGKDCFVDKPAVVVPRFTFTAYVKNRMAEMPIENFTTEQFKVAVLATFAEYDPGDRAKGLKVLSDTPGNVESEAWGFKTKILEVIDVELPGFSTKVLAKLAESEG